MDLRRSHVMSWISLCTPALIFTWQLLWPLVMAAQPLELALDPVRLTSDPPAPTEPWFLHSSDPPPALAHVLSSPADPGSFHFLGSSAAAQRVASPLELTEPLVPFPDVAAEPPPGPDQFAAGLQDAKDQEALAKPSERPEEDEASSLQMEDLAEPSERPDEDEGSPLQMEALAKPSERPEEDEASSLQMEDLAEPSERPDEDEGSPLQMEAVAKPSERPEEDEASSLQMEALAKPSERPEEDEVSSLQMEALAKPSERPEEVQPTSIQQEAQAQPAQPPEDVEPSFIQQEAPTEAPAFPTIPVSNDIVPGVAGLFQADKSTLPGVTLTPIGVELTIIPEPIKDVESSTVQQEAPTQPPESSPGVLDQTSVHPEVTFSPLGLGEAHHQISPPVTLRSMDLGLSITPEPTEEIKTPSQQEAPSQAPEKTKSSPAQQGSPALPPEPLKEAEPSLTQQGVRAQPSEAPQQSPEPSKEVVVQPPLYQEVTVPTSGQDQAPHSLSPSVPVPPLDLGLIVTAEPTTEAKSSAALTKPTAPSPRHLEVTAPHPEQVQSQHPNLVEVTVQPVDLEVTVTREPESSETLPATTEQNASRHMDICKLCTCTDGTLACVGLRPEQRLRRVPELESHSYNGTFTIVDLQGNSISYIDESIWKSYRWVEKLILSENNLSELHKDSFEGLLSLQYLDLSCNRIESIERCTFEPLPFLQYINLGCNSITELGFGTFQAWHGMQFLHSVILDRNPLTIVEDSYLLKLPALRYLDVGRTQVSLTTVESILMMTLQLEKLILPSRVTCCLCQFKNDIEVVCETVKLHCDTECLTDITHCDEEVSIENAEGSFMKVLQARKKSTSSELTIEPEKPSSDTNGINLSAFRNDQLDFNDENDAISALNYILPYFSQGNLTNVESALLPLIKLLFLNIEDGDMPLSHLTNNARNPSVKPESNDATYKNRLRKLNSLKNLLEAEILEKINEVMKKEKTAMLIHSNLSGPKLKRQIFQKELQTDPPQGYSLAKIQPVRKRLQRVNRVLKGPKGIRKRHFEVAHQSIQRKQNALPIVENTLRVRRLRGPPPGELGQMHRVHRLGKLLENFNTEPSSIKEHDAAVSSTQKQYLMGWPSASIAPKSLSEVKKSKDLSETTFILDEANARVRNMKASKPIPHSRKKHLFHRSHSLVMHKKAKAKMSQEFGKEDSLKRLMIAKRPLISAVRSLINSPAREAFSSSGELTSQENRLPESVSVLETSKEKSTAQIPFQKNISTWKATTPEKTTPEIPPRENVFMPESAVTADNFMPTVNQTHEIQEEYLSVVSDLLSNATTFTSPLFSSPGEQLENQLNQQLQSLIPNNDVRKLIVHVIRTLKMDCSEVSVQLPCARLISRTGLLMKLLSEQQEVKVSKAEWDMDRWKNENYINESTEAQREQKGQEPRERTKEVPGHSYYNKVILAISVTVLVMILLIISCLIVINSHRRKSEGGKEGSSRGFFGFLLCKKCPSEQESQSSFWRKQPLWLRDMYKPLNATQKKNRAQKLRDQDSSDEDETIDEDKGELREVITENSSQ